MGSESESGTIFGWPESVQKVRSKCVLEEKIYPTSNFGGFHLQRDVCTVSRASDYSWLVVKRRWQRQARLCDGFIETTLHSTPKGWAGPF